MDSGHSTPRAPAKGPDAGFVTCDYCGQVTRLLWIEGTALCRNCHRQLIDGKQGEA